MVQQQPSLRTFGEGKYELIRPLPLGGGGFADVFLVKDSFGQTWALKQLRENMIANDPKILERFVREVQYQQGLKNSHIASIEDYNAEEGYIVIEYIDGNTLKELLNAKFEYGMDLDTDLSTLLEILRQLEVPLTYLHEEVGLAHLDLSLNNIMIQNRRTLWGGTKLHVMLVDFGLARILDENGWAEVTALAGTPGYLAPEQQGLIKTKLGARSDIYTLGVVIGVMLTGHKPAEVLKILSDDESDEIPPELKHVLQQATAQDPRRRYSYVKKLIVDFTEGIENYRTRKQREKQASSFDPDSTQLAPPTRRLSTRRSLKRSLIPGSSIRRHQWIISISAIVAMLLIVGLLSALIIQGRASQQSHALQPTYTTTLGGLDITGYCASLGYKQIIGELTCSSPINLDQACAWQWNRSDLHNQYSTHTNPYSGVCYDSQGKPIGGISQMGEYCQQTYHNTSVAKASQVGPASWTCQQQTNLDLACSWKYGQSVVEVRNSPSGLICYAAS